METSLVMLPSLNKRLEQLVADRCQKYSDYERQEVPTQFSTPVLDIIEKHVLEQSEIFYLVKFLHYFIIFSNIGNTIAKLFSLKIKWKF